MKKKKIISIALIVLFAACAAFTGMTAYCCLSPLEHSPGTSPR